ncbi:MAG: hypothetical protein GWP74_02300 [Proteobacteria bacterium]|nr:hypothetical protein [Pseudomonadota bacterium]
MPVLERSLLFTAATLLCLVIVPAVHAGPTVALVGDDYRRVVMDEVAARERSQIRRRDGVYELAVESAGVTLRSLTPGDDVTAMADMLQSTDIALIVVNSTVGPTPTIREHILIARQARVPVLAMLLTNVAELDVSAPEEASELLAIEVQEIRELLSAYDLDGNAAGVYFDAETPETVAGVSQFGSREALRALAKFSPRRVRAPDMGPVSEFWGAVYLLTELEANGNAISLAPKDTITVWSEGTQSMATLSSLSQYNPGDYREMSLSLKTPVSAMQGSRILLVRDDRVIGLGAITEITN